MTSGSPSAIEEALARRALPEPAERRRLRLAAGVSQRRLGQDLGVSAQSIAFWESGQRAPRGSHLVNYVDFLATVALLDGRQ